MTISRLAKSVTAPEPMTPEKAREWATMGRSLGQFDKAAAWDREADRLAAVTDHPAAWRDRADLA